MTLPASGSISMAQVLAELQIATPARAYPISLTDTDVRTLAGVPSGAISMSSLYGKSAAYVVNPLPIVYIGDEELSPTNASASLTLGADGTITTTGNTSNAGTNWRIPAQSGVGSSYWVRLTLNGGSAPTGDSVGTWISLGTARTWTWARTTLGTTSSNCTVAVASDSGGTSILTTQTFSVLVAKEV